jgi:hypothetical protein
MQSNWEISYMAITSLNNFGVATETGTQVMLMPKLKYRFRATLLNFGVGESVELTKQVASAARPQFSFEEIDIPVYNSRIYLAGRYQFTTTELVLRDDASGQVQKLVGQQIQKQFDFMEQASARSGIDYKFTYRLQILDGGNAALEPQVLETFEMYGCFVSDVNYGDLAYDSNEAAIVTLTIRYDNAVQFAAGATATSPIGGIGARVGRAIASQATTGAGGSEISG